MDTNSEKPVLTPAEAIQQAQAAVAADEAKLEALLDASRPATPAPSVGMGSTATAVPRAAKPAVPAGPAVSVGLSRPVQTLAEATIPVAAAKPVAAPKVPPVIVDPAQPVKVKFVKLHGISDTIVFKDGSTFQFRWILQSNGQGYQSNSFVVTTDEALINNLREAAKNKALGVVEVAK